MDRYKYIDDKIQEGYRLILEDNCPAGCDQWLDAWDAIKKLFVENIADGVNDLDTKYNFTQFIRNYVQDMEMELGNAGRCDKSYHLKRSIYCEELLQWCGDNELLVSNTRRALANGYFDYGDEQKGEKLYSEWLQDDPDWGWGYIGWSDCYLIGPNNNRYEKAEEILLAGYSRSGLRDRIDVTDRLVSLYGEMGKPDKVKEFKSKFNELQRDEPKGSHYYKPKPVMAEKVGRNDPCPCGSGKKYKKCHGAS